MSTWRFLTRLDPLTAGIWQLSQELGGVAKCSVGSAAGQFRPRPGSSAISTTEEKCLYSTCQVSLTHSLTDSHYDQCRRNKNSCVLSNCLQWIAACVLLNPPATVLRGSEVKMQVTGVSLCETLHGKLFLLHWSNDWMKVLLYKKKKKKNHKWHYNFWTKLEEMFFDKVSSSLPLPEVWRGARKRWSALLLFHTFVPRRRRRRQVDTGNLFPAASRAA